MIAASPRARRTAAWLVAAPLAAVLLFAACSSDSKSDPSTVSSSSTAASSSSPASSSSEAADAAGYTLAVATVPNVGSVLVNGEGKTLYILSSEAGGKVTCTDDNGCTAVWPDTELPEGVTAGIAGTGVDASKMGTAKGPTGDSYLTYGGYPLYTFVHDTAAGTANGQGINSFGGTWTAVTVGGTPATAAN